VRFMIESPVFRNEKFAADRDQKAAPRCLTQCIGRSGRLYTNHPRSSSTVADKVTHTLSTAARFATGFRYDTWSVPVSNLFSLLKRFFTLCYLRDRCVFVLGHRFSCSI